MKMDVIFDEITERLLLRPYWVIDFLPKQVPEQSNGQLFVVEKYYQEEPQRERMCHQFADVLLKLNCYHDLLVNRNTDDKWVKNPGLEVLVAWLNEALLHGHLCVLIDEGDALITASGGDMNLTIYNPSPALLDLVRTLASATGLFLWKPQGNPLKG